MVKVRDDLPINQDGSINLNDWLNRIKQAQHLVDSDQALLLKAGQLSLEYGAHCLTPFGETCFQAGLMTAEILVMLNADQEAIAAALLYFCVIDGKLTEEQVAKQLNSQVSTLIVGVKKVSVVANTNSTLVPPPKTKGFNHQQRDNLRRMLLAIIEDVRVVLIKLAERITALRNCIKLPTTLCQAQALEARDIYAPLANRLGIGQIKWEIEDLAFRYLEPKAYKKIAYLLDEKRISREKYINTLIETIKAQLITNDVVAQVFGRVKHIYSIWRKMLRKAVTFEEIYDVRAIRILVPKLRDCYAALGVVHSLWQHIPKEFDDYIATPKENGYRSLHTAVIGPEGKFLEIQIRTYQMDKEAELGVAAHWMYKEKGRLDTKYQEKLNHLRKTLVDSDKIEDDFESAALLKEEILEERVYVFTPKGQVIDLPSSATPLDFAYHIHTELGHRCRGAKINNQLVPLTYQLKSGDQVEIISSKQGSPSRDWLNPGLGYIKSSRAQAKVVSWYRRQAREQHIIQGREILDKESKKFGLHKLNISKVSAQLNYTKSEDLLVALGSGNVKFSKVLETQDLEEKKKSSNLSLNYQSLAKNNRAVVKVEGISNLLCSFAKCCKPLPGEPVVGYITVGRGISIHREDCINVLFDSKKESRLVKIDWEEEIYNVYPIEIEILVYDRAGILKDISTILANEKINVTDIYSTATKASYVVRIVLNLEVPGLEKLDNLLNKLLYLPNVIKAKRVTNSFS